MGREPAEEEVGPRFQPIGGGSEAEEVVSRENPRESEAVAGPARVRARRQVLRAQDFFAGDRGAAPSLPSKFSLWSGVGFRRSRSSAPANGLEPPPQG